MFELITNLLINFKYVVVVALMAVTGAMMFIAFVKTRSTPAVLGMAALGVASIVLVANITTVANLFGGDVLGNQYTQVTTPVVSGTVGTSPAATTPGTACDPDIEVC